MVLALVAAVFWRHIRREVHALLLVGVLLNLAGVAIDSGLGQINGFLSVISQGGYLLVLMIFIAVLTALGVTTITDYLHVREQTRERAVGLRTRARASLVASCGRRGRVRDRGVGAIGDRAPLSANLRSPAFADIYGQRMLESLPHNAVLLVWGSEYTMPMIYRQVVEHERPDVAVVAADNLAQSWGREEIGRQLHLGTIHGATLAATVKDVITETMKSRPVYLDVFAINAMVGLTGYQTEGLVAKVVPGGGRVPRAAERQRARERARAPRDRRPHEQPGVGPTTVPGCVLGAGTGTHRTRQGVCLAEEHRRRGA